MIVARTKYLGCSAVANRGTCENRRNISTDEISRRVLEAVKANLLTPERVRMAVETYRAERERLAKENARDRRSVERDLAAVERKIKALLTLVENGGERHGRGVELADGTAIPCTLVMMAVGSFIKTKTDLWRLLCQQ
jgi:hypothetical protein